MQFTYKSRRLFPVPITNPPFSPPHPRSSPSFVLLHLFYPYFPWFWAPCFSPREPPQPNTDTCIFHFTFPGVRLPRDEPPEKHFNNGEKASFGSKNRFSSDFQGIIRQGCLWVPLFLWSEGSIGEELDMHLPIHLPGCQVAKTSTPRKMPQ